MLTTANIGNNGLTPEEKKIKIDNLRNYHAELIKQLEVSPTDFNGKTTFMSEGNRVVGIFPGEFNKKNGLLIEFIDSQLNPTDPERKVYKLANTPNFSDIYKLLPSGSSYAVPISDLVHVKLKPIKKIKQKFDTEGLINNLINEREKEEDSIPISKMTIKDFAAIIWKKPVADHEFLNTIINEQLKS